MNNEELLGALARGYCTKRNSQQEEVMRKSMLLAIILVVLCGCTVQNPYEIKSQEPVIEKNLIYSGEIEKVGFGQYNFPIIYFMDGKIIRLDVWGENLDIPAHRGKIMNLYKIYTYKKVIRYNGELDKYDGNIIYKLELAK